MTTGLSSAFNVSIIRNSSQAGFSINKRLVKRIFAVLVFIVLPIAVLIAYFLKDAVPIFLGSEWSSAQFFLIPIVFWSICKIISGILSFIPFHLNIPQRAKNNTLIYHASSLCIFSVATVFEINFVNFINVYYISLGVVLLLISTGLMVKCEHYSPNYD